jgi:tetratricopeptide (TPR) repeat protein
MTSTQRAALAALALTLALAGVLHAIGEGRIVATIVDEAGAPVEGAKVLLTRPGTGYKLEKTSDKKGQVMLLILDATQEYQIHVEKAGFSPYEGPLKPKVEDTMRVTFTLIKPAPSEPEPDAPKEMPGSEQAILTYNEGVAVLRNGDTAGAVPKFEQAAALNPELAEAHAVLAELYLELKRNGDAVAAADRYLVLKPGDPRGLRVRYDAFKAVGDAAKAKEALEALGAADANDPETAIRFFNEGAERTRAGQYDEAAAFFAKVVQIAPDDPKFAKAHYVLGITYAKDGAKKVQAKEHLQKFLQLTPDDPEAETAKQMLDYLK